MKSIMSIFSHYKAASILVLLLSIFQYYTCVDAATVTSNSTRALCYSGSTLYQTLTQDCTTKNTSYTGFWYCAKLEVYEAFQTKYREPIITRGCATEQECLQSSSSVYDNTQILSNGLLPGGMKIIASCCQANNFPTDDTIAIDYSLICNSSYNSKDSINTMTMVVLAAITALVWGLN